MLHLLSVFRVHLVCFVLGGVVFRWGPDLLVSAFSPPLPPPPPPAWIDPPIPLDQIPRLPGYR